MTLAERARLAGTGSLAAGLEEGNPWYLWGPYLAERAWGTVREDYSPDCSGWNWVSHDAARSKAYRWNEDGLAGICDAGQRLCLGLALWNGVDPILKERCFGLTNAEGNHGEDVKEYWWYPDALPSHAWLRWRYHYPQRPFPYAWLVDEAGRRRAAGGPEPELLDSGVFDDDRYWVVDVAYAKTAPDDVLMRISVTNAGPERATLHVLPTLWFRNTWSVEPDSPRPLITVDGTGCTAEHPTLGVYRLLAAPVDGSAQPLCCDNDTNAERLYGAAGTSEYPKDGINDHVVHGAAAVNPAGHGTKAAYWYRLSVDAGQTVQVRLRLHKADGVPDDGAWSGTGFDAAMAAREREADEFYAALTPADATADEATVMRQAFAGLVWSKQFYAYDVARWLDGDPGQVPPPPQRRQHPPGRNLDWRHLRSADVFSMPDPWEYPWFASWDLAFHAIVMAHIDPAFAKHQLRLLCLDRFQHPDGNLPAYEWEFSDANPPVHAWAAMKVYRLDGSQDRAFLSEIFDRLLRNFAWWSERQDPEHDQLFTGGFLGLDNVGPFNRSSPPPGITLEQADATAWMACYCLSMLHIAVELAREDPAYEERVHEFLDRFAAIAAALTGHGLWDAADGFFYDRVRWADGSQALVKVRSIVGVIPLFANAVIPDSLLDHPAAAAIRAHDEDRSRPHRLGALDRTVEPVRTLISLADRTQVTTVLREVLDEAGFLSPYGIRSLSRRHLPPSPASPGANTVDGPNWSVDYEPAEANDPSVNSNWRGPVWFPVNYLLIECLARLGAMYGDGVTVQFPTGSATLLRLDEVAAQLRRRLIALFLPGPDGRRPSYGWVERFRDDPRWRDQVLFFEYFHADNGAGLGASHQTGWTALVADLITGRRLGGEESSW